MTPRGCDNVAMKIAIETADGANRFTGYGDGYVDVNGTRHHANVVVAAGTVSAGWFPGSLDDLTEERVGRVAEMRPEIVLLGTGARFRFPPAAVLAPLYRAGIGVEVMDTRAACRTYNVLLGEGRRVVAAVIVDPAA